MTLLARTRRVARITYEKLLAPLGNRALDTMLGDGLPPRLEPALRFLFTSEAPQSEHVAVRIERLRSRIAARDEVYRFNQFDTSLGPMKLAEQAQNRDGAVTSHRVATAFSVSERWGMFLHLCAEAFDARIILEMGACVGISGAYLASSRSRPRVLSLEGSEPLAAIAQSSLDAVSDQGEVIVGPFEQTLPPTLARFGESEQTIDLAFVDGHHEEAATLHYVAAIEPHLSPRALMILDDIYLYEGMWRAWQTLASADGVVAINVGRFGLLVYDRERTAGRYDLSRYTGHWRVGHPRNR